MSHIALTDLSLNLNNRQKSYFPTQEHKTNSRREDLMSGVRGTSGRIRLIGCVWLGIKLDWY